MAHEAPVRSSKVAVVGGPGVGKKSLVRGLLAVGGVIGVGTTIESEMTATLPLSNKYFDVVLDLFVGGLNDAALLAGAEAVILVVSASDGAALAAVEQLSATIDAIEPQLVVVVSNKTDAALGVRFDSDYFSGSSSALDVTDGPEAYRTLVAQLDDAALDKGYEHVPCCALAPHFTSQSRDKAGVARVYEALANVAWKAARMRHGGAAKASASTLTEGPETFQIGASASAAAPGAADAEVAATPAPATRGHAGDAPAPESTVNAAALADLVASEKDMRSAAHGVGGDDAEGEDHAVADVSRLLEEIKHVRSAALTGGMSDEQRRAAAAQMALRLFEMLGGTGSDDEEED